MRIKAKVRQSLRIHGFTPYSHPACELRRGARNNELDVAGATKQHDGQITSDYQKSCQAKNLKESKIFRFAFSPNHLYIYRHPVPLRGALAIVTTRDGLRWTRRCP